MASVHECKNESTSLEPKADPSGESMMTENGSDLGNLEEEASKCWQPSKEPSCTGWVKSLMRRRMSKIEDTGNATRLGTIANFVNSTIGAGIMGLPYALNMTGCWFGIITYTLSAVMVFWGYIFLVDAGLKVNKLNYETIFRELYGSWGVYNFTFTLYLNTVGVLTAYILLLGSSISSLLELFSAALVVDERYIMIFVVCAILFPISLLENMHDFVWISYISCICIFVMWGVTVIGAPLQANVNDQYSDSTLETDVFIKPTFIKGLGIQALSLVCSSYTFLMYRSLKQATLNTWKCVVTSSLLCICVFGVVLMLSGYLSFGDQTNADILLNFPATNWSATTARICLVLNITFTFPVTINTTIYMDLFKMPDMTMSRHIFLTALNLAIPLGICLITQDLGQVFNITGAYTATMLGYTFPGVLYIGAFKNEFWDIINTWGKFSLWEKIRSLKAFYLPVAIFVYGFFIFICGVLGIVL